MKYLYLNLTPDSLQTIENLIQYIRLFPSAEKINYTLAILSPRKIDNGNSIKYKNEYYQSYEKCKLVCFRPKTECLVIKTFDDKMFIRIDEKNIYPMAHP